MKPKATAFPPAMIEELKQTPWWQGEMQIEPVNAGVVNHNFILKSSAGQCFVKVFNADLAVNLDRQVSFDLQKALFEQGMAPEPLYLSEDNTFQLDAWSHDLPLSHPGLDRARQLIVMADMMASLHQVKVTAPSLDLPGQWQHYLKHIPPDTLEISTEEIDKKITAYSQIWQQADKRCFCHHDVSPFHILYGQSMTLLDWEYAAYSSPWFDLASCIEINRLSILEQGDFVRRYCHKTQQDVEQGQTCIRQMLPLVKFTNLLWYAATAENQ